VVAPVEAMTTDAPSTSADDHAQRHCGRGDGGGVTRFRRAGRAFSNSALTTVIISATTDAQGTTAHDRDERHGTRRFPWATNAGVLDTYLCDRPLAEDFDGAAINMIRATRSAC
jgi:hypothetical protein